MKFSILQPQVLVSLAALSVACSSDPPAPATTGASQTTGTATTGGGNYCDASQMMQRTCSGLTCHRAPGKPAGLVTDFFNPPAGQSMAQVLMNKPANYELVADPTTCPTANPELLINSAAPSESLIIKKVMGTNACGQKMPNTTAPELQPTQAEIDCLVSWVYGVITDSTGTATSSNVTTSSVTTSSVTTGSATMTTGTATTGGTTTGVATVTGSGGASSTGGATTSGSTGTGGAGTTGGPVICNDPDENSALEPTFATFKAMMVASPNGPCSASDCHGVNDVHPEKLVLEDDAGLLDRMKTHVAHRCNDLLVIQPGQPENSALVRALNGECTDATTGMALPRMPGGCNPEECNCFYPSWMAAIEAWIAAGAPDN